MFHRSFPIGPDDFTVRDDSDGWSFHGIASRVGVAYDVVDWLGAYSETIAEGAFDRSLSNPNNRISLLVNHEQRAIPLATVRAGTLELRATPHLEVTATLDPANPRAAEVRSALTRGDMAEMSIGFNDVGNGRQWNEDGTESTVTELALREVSIVAEGANPYTAAGVREAASIRERLQIRGINLEAVVADLAGLVQQDLDDDTVDDYVPISRWTELVDRQPWAEQEELPESTGLVVTDAMLDLWAKRLG